VPKVPKVKRTKMTITCFRPVFIGLKMGFPILLNYGNNLLSILEANHTQKAKKTIKPIAVFLLWVLSSRLFTSSSLKKRKPHLSL